MLLTGTNLLVLLAWGTAMIHGHTDTRRGSYAGMASVLVVFILALVFPIWIPVAAGTGAALAAISVMNVLRWRSTSGTLGDRLMATLGLGRA